MEKETKKQPFNSYEYINNYTKTNYDRITIIRKKGEKEKLNEIAKSKGYRTLTEFVNQCIDEKLKRMKVNL